MIDGVLFDHQVLEIMLKATRRYSPLEAGGLLLDFEKGGISMSLRLPPLMHGTARAEFRSYVHPKHIECARYDFGKSHISA